MSWRTNAAVKPLRVDPSGKKISTIQKLILLILSDYISDEKGFAWVSIPRLAAECLLTDRSMYRSLKQLEVRGLITIERRKATTNLYRLSEYVMRSVGGVTECQGGGDQAVSGGDDIAVSAELDKNKSEQYSKFDFEKASEYIRKRHPRSDAPLADRQAIRKAISRVHKERGITLDEAGRILVAATKSYADQRAGEDRKFTKTCSAWFNGGAYVNFESLPKREPKRDWATGAEVIGEINARRAAKRG